MNNKMKIKIGFLVFFLFLDIGYISHFTGYNTANKIVVILSYIITALIIWRIVRENMQIMQKKNKLKKTTQPIIDSMYSETIPKLNRFRQNKILIPQEQLKNVSNSDTYTDSKTYSDTEKPLSQRDDLFPSPDYIKTIFLHMFEKHPYKEDDSFPEYFRYEYGIINMPMYFNEIKDEGLITLSPPEEILNLLKVSELKDILSERALKKSGKKSELIERILSHIDADELPIINEYYFSLSPTGKKYIETHHDYIMLKQHPEWGIDFWEYQNEKDKTNGIKSFNEIILSLLNAKILEIKKSKFEMSHFEYSKLHDLYISAYQIFLNEECYVDALKALLKNVLLSLSGCRNHYLIGYKKDFKLKNQEVMVNYSPLKIDSYVATSICKLKEYYNENILSDVYNEFIGPYNLCTYEMFREVTTLIFNSSILELSKYDNIVRDLFIKKLK